MQLLLPTPSPTKPHGCRPGLTTHRSSLSISIGQSLEVLSIQIYNVLYQSHNFEDPVLDRLTSDFKSVQEDDGQVTDWETTLNDLKNGYSRNVRKEILDICTDVDELAGRATVWMHLRVHHHGTTPANLCVTSMHWERRKHKWMCCKRTSVRGVQSYF